MQVARSNKASQLPAQVKDELRKHLRAARRMHVLEQDEKIRALLLHRPPAPVLDRIAADAALGLYHSSQYEAPTGAYAQFFFDRGHPIALPHFASRDAPMQFRPYRDPYGESDLEKGPFGAMQADAARPEVVPDVLFVPLLGFTAEGHRLGQGGGHYDRWLAAHPETLAIGLAWDVQLQDELPLEEHDIALDLVVTPTRIYGAG